jgi:hypothetical protein
MLYLKNQFSSENVFSGCTLPTLTFLYFYVVFVSKCIPRNHFCQAETQNLKERQIAVVASKPNLGTFSFWKCLRHCDVISGPQATNIEFILNQRSDTIKSARQDRGKKRKRREKEEEKEEEEDTRTYSAKKFPI